MIKRLTRHGNSYALVIDRAVLELLNIDTNDSLEITTDGRMLIIEPVRGRARQRKFCGAVEAANRKYGRMLKRLAE
jgi:antitoxin component of MazEF toxin-antitoxin module